jgi:sensor c-di-GMP phosphodiesterase-like protein
MYALRRNRRDSMQCIASLVVFVAMKTCSNSSPSSSDAFRVATGTCSAKPRPDDRQIAAFRRHVIIRIVHNNKREFCGDHTSSKNAWTSRSPDLLS